MSLNIATLTLLICLVLTACCNPPATQTLDSSFIAKVTAQPTPNQIIVLYGQQTLTLIFEKATYFDVGQKLYVQGQLAGSSIKVKDATKLN
jgi:hypothetical protein